MKIIECDQRSPEWVEARCGIPTASGFDKIVTSDGKSSKQRTKYLYQLAGERVSGILEEGYQNGAMLRGIEIEAEARKFYEFTTEQKVLQVGFCLCDGWKYGCSPDGLVGTDGLIQIKCPKLATHVEYLLENKLPTDYFQQVQGEMLVTDRQWSDFVSYYPGIRPLVVRVVRNESFLTTLRAELVVFCSELNQIVKRIS